MALPSSQWAIDLDNIDEQPGAGKGVVDSGKAKAPAGAKVNKPAKGAKGKPKGAQQQHVEENTEAGNVENPMVIAQFGAEGAVIGLWCRCVRDAEVSYACTPLDETCPTSWPSAQVVNLRPPRLWLTGTATPT